MQMPAKFHEIPSMGLQDIKETKRYGRTQGRTDGRTDGRENSIPPLKLRFGGGYKLKLRFGGGINKELIGMFVFIPYVVQCLFFLNLKFQVSSLLLGLYSLVCVGPGWKPKLLVFSCEGSFIFNRFTTKI